MKSIKQQYIDLKEGKMSQANFMRNLRMMMPQYITNVTSFNDSVKILKNKGILNEMSNPRTENWLEGFKSALDEMGIDYSNLSSENILNQYGDIKDPYKAAEKFIEDMTASSIEKAEEEEAGKYTTGGEQFEINEEGNLDIDQEELKKGIEVEKEHTDDPVKAEEIALDHLKEDPKYYTKLKKAKLEEGWTNTSGKAMYDQFKEIDNLNAQEVLIGIDCEMQKNTELSKKDAAKIVIKKLKKNPLYYTMEYLAGKEGAEAEYMSKSTKPEDWQMKPVKGNSEVDKKMGMQPVKGIEKPKKDSDTATAQKYKTSGISLMSLVAKTVRGLKKMDATGEKMKTIKLSEVKFNDFGDPNKATSAAMQFINSNPTLKAISDELTIQNSHDDAILRYGYWDTLPNEAISKLEMQFDVEEMNDFDEDTGDIIAYRLTPKGSPYKFQV